MPGGAYWDILLLMACKQVLAMQYIRMEPFSCKMVCLEMNHAMHLIFLMLKNI